MEIQTSAPILMKFCTHMKLSNTKFWSPNWNFLKNKIKLNIFQFSILLAGLKIWKFTKSCALSNTKLKWRQEIITFCEANFLLFEKMHQNQIYQGNSLIQVQDELLGEICKTQEILKACITNISFKLVRFFFFVDFLGFLLIF